HEEINLPESCLKLAVPCDVSRRLFPLANREIFAAAPVSPLPGCRIVFQRRIRSVHIRVRMLIKDPAYLRYSSFKFLNDTIQVTVIVKTRHSVGGKDVVDRHNQKLINTGFCLLIFQYWTDNVVFNREFRRCDLALFMYLCLEILLCVRLAPLLGVLFIRPRQYMGLILCDIVRLNHREPYRRLLAFDYGPAIITDLEDACTVSRHIKCYFIRHVKKAV